MKQNSGLSSALNRRREFNQRWFLVPIGVALAPLFAVVMIAMRPDAAPILVEAVLPGDGIVGSIE